MIRRLSRALALALLLALVVTAPSGAQDRSPAPLTDWTEALARATALTADTDAPTEDLETARDRLQRLRSAAIEEESVAAARLADANARLAALGPAPEEGATEPDELTARRQQITADVAAAQAPVLEAQDFQRQAESLIRGIDRIVRARFAAELRSRGSSPLRPSNWATTLEALGENLAARRGSAEAALSQPETRSALLQRTPFDLMLAIVGIAIAFSLRLRLVRWVEDALSRATSPKTIALLVNLRNFSRLIVPAIGAGLLFAALDPDIVLDPTARSKLFVLPDFVLAIVAASWLGSSIFAPRLPAYRLAPVEDADARAGSLLALALGGVLAAHLFLKRYVADFDMSPAEVATLEFPLFAIGGLLMWRCSRMMRIVRRRVVTRDRGAATSDRTGALSLSGLLFVERFVWAVAFLAPAAAMAGYLAAATYLLYSTILTLALFGAGIVIYDLATTTFGAMSGRRAEPGWDPGKDGLGPVLVGALLSLAALPALALIWGARVSDIADVGFMLRDGVTLGGIRISLGTLVTFTVVFGALYGLSRVLQSLLRNSVLPRTRMDAGGRNAVLAGVGYFGFFIATIVAVSSTGIDLTSLAFVAGALSVGIGFGLQNIVSNFVSGIILLVERPIKEGDWIEVGGQMGYVRDISVRSTVIETFDRASLILPNSDLVAGTVLNRMHTGMSGRLTVPVGVSYASDPRHVERVLLAIAEDHPMVLLDPAARVLFMGFGADSLNFEIRCWLRDVNFSLSARSDINYEIFERFNAEGISIPFPQREVRIKNAEELGAAMRAQDPAHDAENGASPIAKET